MTESTGKRPRRANGEGSIYPFRDGWRGAAVYTDDQGRRRRRVFSARLKDDVRRRMAAFQADADRGMTPPESMTVGAFLLRWLEASRQRIRPSTWRGYETNVRVYLIPAFGKVELAKLTPSQVERMTADLEASGRAPRTAAMARTILRRALADAQRDGLAHRNVAALARPPHVPGRALEAGRDYLTAEQLRQLISVAALHPLGPLVTLAASTGLRQGEILGLSWPDVDRDAGRLTVRRSLARVHGGGFALAETKTRRSRRTIDLPKAARAALERQSGLQETARDAAGTAWQDVDELVFTDAVGRALRGSDVNHGFHRLLDAAGLPSIPFHGLRHSCATAMLAAGIPLKTVSDHLGHSTIVVTADRYAGLTPELRRDAAAAMDRALDGES